MKPFSFHVFSLIAVLIGSLLAGPADAADPVAERGLEHSSDGRQLLKNAVERVNRLTSEAGFKLQPSWKATRSITEDIVPVYLVKETEDTLATPALVPRRCRCIFVMPAVLYRWIEWNSKGSGRLKLSTEDVLVFMMLHEVGHLRNATAGAAIIDGALSQLNVESSQAKKNEEMADDFAANLLKRHARTAKVSSLSIDANWVVSELTKLSWNMQAFRTIDEFGSFAIGKPSVYFDSGYTHPNLAWRILRVNHLIHQSAETAFLLQTFEEARERGANPSPLYQRP